MKSDYASQQLVRIIISTRAIPARAITAEYQAGDVSNVMMHDGSWVRLRKVAEDYDPTDRDQSYLYIRARQQAGEVVTGLLYISQDSKDMHEQLGTTTAALSQLPYESLCPGSAELEKLQQRFR